MKRLKCSIVALFVSLLFINCKKSDDKPAPTSSSLTGVWEGKFGTDNDKPSVFFSFNIKAGGIIEELTATGQVKGIGTWKLDNNIFTASYSYLPPSTMKYSIIGAFDGIKLLGNWGYNNSATDGGLWEMTRKN